METPCNKFLSIRHRYLRVGFQSLSTKSVGSFFVLRLDEVSEKEKQQ